MLKELEQIGTPEELKEYRCQVISFSERHLMLVIQIHHEQIAWSGWRLTFIGVFYVESPMFWKGATFEKASDEVSIEVWRRVHPDLSDKRVEQINRMFSVCTVSTPIKPILIGYGGLNPPKREMGALA